MTSNKIHNALKIFLLLANPKYSTYFFHYPYLGFPIGGLPGLIFSYFFLVLLRKVKNRARLILDVADLPVEQASTMNLSSNIESYKYIERRLFPLADRLILASFSMKKYVSTKYSIDHDTCSVIINGSEALLASASALQQSSSSYLSAHPDILKCIYAGSLNKGRDIESLLNLFSGLSQCHLFLIGPNGDWIRQKYSNNLSQNIHYLESLPQPLAHLFVSTMDLGLIPYDHAKPYYQIAYPIKLSFYLTGGIPVLSTPLPEFIRQMNDNFIGYSKPIHEWHNFLSEYRLASSTVDKIKIKSISHKYTWPFVLSKLAPETYINDHES